MEQKKTQRADLENKRLTGFLIGLVVALSLFLLAMEYTTTDGTSNGDADRFDDMSQEMDLMPAPDRTDMVAAVQLQAKKALAQKVKVVDKKSHMEKLNDITKMRTVGEGSGTADGNGLASGSKDTDADVLQPVAVDMGDNPLNFRVVEQLPEFPGGMAALVKWLTDNLRYPPIAKSRSLQGRVVVSFIINRDGSVSDLKLAKSAHPLLDKEAMRVARMMPRWKPGIANNKPCRTMFAIPIEFRI